MEMPPGKFLSFLLWLYPLQRDHMWPLYCGILICAARGCAAVSILACCAITFELFFTNSEDPCPYRLILHCLGMVRVCWLRLFIATITALPLIHKYCTVIIIIYGLRAVSFYSLLLA